MTIDRRSMLRGAFALASFAVIPGTALALPQDDRQRLAGMLAKPGTIISGQEFHFYNGETIRFAGLRDITITDCKFVWHDVAPKPAAFDMRGSRNITMKDSVIDMGTVRPHQSAWGILRDHQS